MRGWTEHAARFVRSVPRKERIIVTTAALTSIALVLVYVAVTHPNQLAGDQSEYHEQGVFFSEGRLWWSTTPFGEPHASAWKAPLYTVWVGGIYTLAGTDPTAVLILQALLAGLTVLLTWCLARRIFGPSVAIPAAWVVAVFPLVWEWFGLLYTEALAIPLTLIILMAFVDRRPSMPRAIALGALLGVAVLLRPSSFFLFAGAAATFVIASGWKRGIGFSAVTAAVAILVVAPWTIRNAIVADGFIPVSVQDAAAYGTFNEIAAEDPVYPYAWRWQTPEAEALVQGPPISDAEFRSRLNDAAFDYIREHPFSVVEAFYWNGLSRFWDVRRPARAMIETDFEGRSSKVTAVGLAGYYVLLPLALYGLWSIRRRRRVVVPLLVMALAASITFTSASGTRYRAPLEPVIAMLAVAGLAQGRGHGARVPDGD